MPLADWDRIFRELQLRGETIRSISECIGTNFRNQVYGGYSMSHEAFKRLEELYGKQIDTWERGRKSFVLNHSGDLAEVIGILLGDGHVSRNGIVVTLNILERDYGNYVTDILERVWGLRVRRRESGVQRLIINSRSLSRALLEMGLQSNKVREQVEVPRWIRDDPEFSRRCVKGLVDTDGSIYLRMGKYPSISFSNRSVPLLDFFENFCNRFRIRTSRSTDAVLVQAKADVMRFVDIVRPEKSNHD